MVTIFYSNARARNLTKISEPKAGAWCHVVDPTKEELAKVAKLFKLEEDILHDATDIYEAPRVETEGETVYVFTRYCHPAGQDIATEPLLIIYTPNNIITVMRKDDSVLDQLINDQIETLTTQKTKFFLHILDEINRSYRIQLTTISKRVLQVRTGLRKAEISNYEFVSFLELEEDLNEFLTALQPQSAVLNSLKTGRYMKLYEEDRDLIDDISLSTTELIELTKSRLRTLVNIRQAYDTIATNNLNRTFKRLTSIGIFLTIPMIAAGVWGMNIVLPFQDDRLAFWKLTLGVAVVTYLAIYFFHKKRWL
jgi:magnesium transporter